MKPKETFVEIAETIIVSYIVLIVIFKLVAFPEQVSGASMRPTLATGDRILVQRVSKLYRDFSRGEVVVLTPPGDNDIHYVKRIVGLPGDIIKINDCEVFITKQGEKFSLDETYLAPAVCTSGGTVIREGRALRLGDNEYMVLGDNRENSADSRFFGVVTRDRILGAVIFRFWPPKEVGFF